MESDLTFLCASLLGLFELLVEQMNEVFQYDFVLFVEVIVH